MISIDWPHMGLNDPRSTNRVQMWNTWDASPVDSVDHLIGWVAVVAKGAPGGMLKSIVFRCHGGPAFLQCGAGIRMGDVDKFKAWNGLVDKIWFSACLVGYIQPGAGDGPGPASQDGNTFCSRIAKNTQAYVVASTELQVIGVNRVRSYGTIDTYEGLVLSYGPSGVVTWSQRYPSTYNRGASGWAQNPD